mgnify:CR=1 FL=1
MTVPTAAAARTSAVPDPCIGRSRAGSGGWALASGAVIAEVAVDLPRDRRADEAAVEAYRAALLRQNQALFPRPD